MAEMLPELITLIGKAKTGKDLAEAAKNSSDFADKAGDMKDLIGAIEDFLNSFNVSQPALTAILGEINAQTIKTRTELMTDLLKEVQSPEGKEAIHEFSQLINEMIKTADDILKVSDNSGALKIELGDLTFDLMVVTKLIRNMDRFISALNDSLSKANNNLASWITTLKTSDIQKALFQGINLPNQFNTNNTTQNQHF